MASPWRCALPASRERTMGDERGKGLAWWCFSFFFPFLPPPPLFFFFLSPSWKAKAIRNKANNEGFPGCRVRGGLMGWRWGRGGAQALRFSFPAPGVRP